MFKKIFKHKKRNLSNEEKGWCAREYMARGSCCNRNSYGTVCERCGKCGRVFLFGYLIGNKSAIVIIIVIVMVLICPTSVI